jgi:hypothetical protein
MPVIRVEFVYTYISAVMVGSSFTKATDTTAYDGLIQ